MRRRRITLFFMILLVALTTLWQPNLSAGEESGCSVTFDSGEGGSCSMTASLSGLLALHVSFVHTDSSNWWPYWCPWPPGMEYTVQGPGVNFHARDDCSTTWENRTHLFSELQPGATYVLTVTVWDIAEYGTLRLQTETSRELWTQAGPAPDEACAAPCGIEDVSQNAVDPALSFISSASSNEMTLDSEREAEYITGIQLNGILNDAQIKVDRETQLETFAGEGTPIARIRTNLGCGGGQVPYESECGGDGSGADADVCFAFHRAWATYNQAGQMRTGWGLRLEWCVNKGTGKIYWLNKGTGSDDNGGYCYRYGGFWQYVGCEGTHGAMQQTSLWVGDDWHFRLWSAKNNVYWPANPRTSISLYANGGVTGTVNFE